MHLAQFINQPKRSSKQQLSTNQYDIIQEKCESDTGTNLASERVHQLRKEIEDLDSKLLNTNTINFEEIRQSFNNEDQLNHGNEDRLSTKEEDDYFKTNSQIQNYVDFEETYIRKSQSQSFRYPPNLTMKTADLQASDAKRAHTPLNDYFQETQFHSTNLQHWNPASTAQRNNNYMINTSYLSADGDVSFDYEKIIAQRNQNLRSAFENNLQDKWECIHHLQLTMQQLKKECEAKALKMSHLKYERDSLNNQIQAEGQKKKENVKEAQDELRRIQIKKKEDQRAYSLAQGEIKRQIHDQELIIAELIEQIKQCEANKNELARLIDSRRSQGSLSSVLSQHNCSDLQDKIMSHTNKVQSLLSKKKDVETNIKVLKDFLRQITEEIHMTQEDLSGKLIQRAELVAQREELDQMYESGKSVFGKDFELFLRIKEKQSNQTSESSARYILQEYEQQKTLSFISDVLNQLRQASKNKYQEKIDQLQWRLDQSGMSIDLDTLIHLVYDISTQVNLQLDKALLHKKILLSSHEKDALFEKRHVQLNEILVEIKRFEKMIKDNTNLVDNMILPQLKAMTTTFNEHKAKYKKLKQALFVLKERHKKAERELEELNQEQNRVLQHQNVGSKVKKLEQELKSLSDRLSIEQQEMDRLTENAEQVEREFRRAQQSLYLKEREINHRLGTEGSQSLGNTQQSVQIPVIKENDERLRKRLLEVEEKIRTSLEERDEVQRKYNECQKMLNEAKESFEHAQQMMKSTQRIIESNQTISHSQTTSQRNLNTISCESNNYRFKQNQQQQSNNRRHYTSQNHLTFIQEQDMASESVSDTVTSGYKHLQSSQQVSHAESRQMMNNFTSLQPSNQSNHSSNRDIASNLGSLKSLSSHKQQPVENNSFNQRTKLSSIENQLPVTSVSHQRQQSKDKVKRIDLTKVYAMRENNNNQQKTYTENSNPYGQQMKVNQPRDINNHNFNSKNATTGTNLLQSELEPQNPNDTSNLLNLSDLVMNNSTLQNFIQMSGLQDSRSQTQNSNNLLSPYDHDKRQDQQKPSTYLTFNNTSNKQALDKQDSLKKILNSQDNDFPLQQNQRPIRKDIIVGSGKVLSDSATHHPQVTQSNYNQESHFHNTQSDNTLFLIDSVGPNTMMMGGHPNNNSSCLVDSSLVQCLNEINQIDQYQQQNQFYSNNNYDQQIKRPSTGLKRSSVETADFFHNQVNNNQTNNFEPLIFQGSEIGGNQIEEEGYQQQPEIMQGMKSNNSFKTYEINMQRMAPLQQHSICQDDYSQSQYDTKKLVQSLHEYQRQSRDYTYSNNSQIKTASNSKVQNNYVSRTEDTNTKRRSESISPQPISRKGSNNRLKNKFWNRSTSLEKRYGSKINLSIGSIPSSINYMTIHNQSCYEQQPQPRSNSRLAQTNKKSHKLNKSVNNMDSSSFIMRQSVNSSVINPVNISLHNLSQFKNQQQHQHSCNSNFDNSNLGGDILQFTKVDVYFANRIKPLLEGTTFYKKFSSKLSLNENAFDPLQTDKYPPETCGYGIRWFQLDKSLSCINVRQSLKNAVETTIQINDIVKTIIPQTTRDIINAQKYKYHYQTNHMRKSSRNPQLNSSSCASSTKDLLEEFLILDNVGGISSLAKIGIVNKNSEMYRQKCVDTTFYPFSLALANGRIELIATSYEILKIWIIGVNLLVSNKKQVPKIKQLMNINLDN